MRTLIVSSALWLSVVGCFLAPATAEAAAKHYLLVRGVEEADGVKSGVTAELGEMFVAELKKHPELIVLADADALAAAQKQHNLPALEVALRVLAAGGRLDDPKPGKQYRVLDRFVRLAVFGNTLPQKTLAIGGDGDGEMKVEIGRQADVEKEGKALTLDCAKVAVTQAVNMTVQKLNLQGKTIKAKK